MLTSTGVQKKNQCKGAVKNEKILHLRCLAVQIFEIFQICHDSLISCRPKYKIFHVEILQHIRVHHCLPLYLFSEFSKTIQVNSNKIKTRATKCYRVVYGL